MTQIEMALAALRDYKDGEIPTAELALRAIIAAIREPSEGMVEAAILSTAGSWPEDRVDDRDIRTEFQAAIDALLAEGLTPKQS